MITRSFFSICSDDLEGSCQWYVELFDYKVAFHSDWFIHLQAKTSSQLELGIISRSHEIVSPTIRGAVNGGMLTQVVDDVDRLHQQVVEAGIPVIEAPRNLFYGQRRMLLRDPNGLLIDVSSECPPDPAWLDSIR